MALNINGKEVRVPAILEAVFDWAAAAVIGGFVWAIFVTDGPLKDNWFGIALALTAFGAMLKFMRSFKMIDR